MTWRFWQWPARLAELRSRGGGIGRKGICEECARIELAAQERMAAPLTADAERRVQTQRTLALAGITDEHPVWQAVLALADENARNMRSVAFRPALADGVRQFNAGGAANAEEFAGQLRRHRQLAVQHARRLKGDK